MLMWFYQAMAIIADFMLVYLPAPTVPLRPLLATSAGPIANFFHRCPDNAFQVSFHPPFICIFWRNFVKILPTFRPSHEYYPATCGQVALSGTSYSFLQRIGAIVVSSFILKLIPLPFELVSSNAQSLYACFCLQRNGAKLFAVGTTSSLVSFLHYSDGCSTLWLRS